MVARPTIGHTGGVESALGTVLVVFGVGAVIAMTVTAMALRESPYEHIGRGGLSLDMPDTETGPPPGSAAARAEADAEIRQMVEAKSALRESRGEEPLDVEAEIAALRGGPVAARDAGLREEVRQIVVARNERRARRGEAPLEVEAEVDRQLREMGA